MKRDVCSNKWCRATYEFEGEDAPGFCQKCNSFNNQLSGGVTWQDRNYNEPLYDGKEHRSTMIINDHMNGKIQVLVTKIKLFFNQ